MLIEVSIIRTDRLMSTATPEKTNSLSVQKQRLFELLNQYSFKTGDFILASGKRSNFYLDCRMTTLQAEGSSLIGQLMLEKLKDENIDAVGGMTMGADPIVSAITVQSALSACPINGFLVRKEPKGHGAGKQVEGHLEPWMRIVLVEDVATTGGSTVKAIQAVRRECPDVQIVKVLSIVDREAGAKEAFAAEGVGFETLYSIQEFL